MHRRFRSHHMRPPPPTYTNPNGGAAETTSLNHKCPIRSHFRMLGGEHFKAAPRALESVVHRGEKAEHVQALRSCSPLRSKAIRMRGDIPAAVPMPSLTVPRCSSATLSTGVCGSAGAEMEERIRISELWKVRRKCLYCIELSMAFVAVSLSSPRAGGNVPADLPAKLSREVPAGTERRKR